MVGRQGFICCIMFINRPESKAYNYASGNVSKNAVGVMKVCEYIHVG